MSMLNSFIDGAKKILAEEKTRKQDSENQKNQQQLAIQQQEAWEKFWERYWVLALVLWEVVCEKHSLLKATVPSEPSRLKPTTPLGLNQFQFIIEKNSNNELNSEAAVLRHEVCEILKRGLLACMSNNAFDVFCYKEDYYCYYITMRDYGVEINQTLSKKIGNLFVNKYAMYDNCGNFHWHYFFDIRFYDGTHHGYIEDGTDIEVYHEGVFMPSTTQRNLSNNDLFLSREPAKPRAEFNYIVRIK